MDGQTQETFLLLIIFFMLVFVAYLLMQPRTITIKNIGNTPETK